MLWFNFHTCQLSRFCRESPSFSSNLPVSRLDYQISREIATVAFLKLFFHKFRTLRSWRYCRLAFSKVLAVEQLEASNEAVRRMGRGTFINEVINPPPLPH